jgi:hypothetical protein
MDQPEDVLQKYDRLARERFGRRRGAVVARFASSTGGDWQSDQTERIRRRQSATVAQPQPPAAPMPATPALPMAATAPPLAPPLARAAHGDLARLYARYREGKL